MDACETVVDRKFDVNCPINCSITTNVMKCELIELRENGRTISPSLWDVKSTFIKKQPLHYCVKEIVLAIAASMLVILVMLLTRYLNENAQTKLNVNTSNNKQLIDSRNKENYVVLPIDDDVNAYDYFTLKCDHDLDFFKFYNGLELQKGFDEEPRILDMCFVKIDRKIHLVYIDADNMRIVDRDVSDGSKNRDFLLTREPNRMAKINDTTIAVIYKKGFDIMIFDVVRMTNTKTYSITQSNIMKSVSGIQGILALSRTKLILSDKTHLYSCELNHQKTTTNVQDFARSVPEFDTARRLTHVTVSQSKKIKSDCNGVIFIADENDKKLTSIGINGCKIDEQTGQNRGLQNVRAIGATERKVYAAVSAGISVFSHNKGAFKKQDKRDKHLRDYEMIVEYKLHVEHTRGLCLEFDGDSLYIGLSCIIKEKDAVLLFKFKPEDYIGVH
ncbi:unnamed protein product [Mytilus coruscus]|uniref:Uncharacterized protein n=1 Tax=Mytilus coruscus TaxID=42192 RepID=A0A6J8B624_MYTCO|nr:unnamed protein product [Mytilus coruscus]